MKKNTLLILISLFALASCGAGKNVKEEAKQTYDYAKPSEEYKAEMASEEGESDGQSPSELEDPDTYIERFVYLDLETTNYDKDFENIKKSAKGLEGLIENESTFFNSYNVSRDLKTTEFTIKIPRDRTEKFDQVLADIGKTMSINKNSNNLRTAFRDVDKDLEIKAKQLEKFNELLDKTNNIEDTLVINAKIIEIQSEIEAVKKAKADLKTRVTYDTYNISLREVFSYDERANNPYLGDRIKEAMGESLGIVKEFFSQIIVGFFLFWPFILIIIAIVFIVLRVRKKKLAKK